MDDVKDVIALIVIVAMISLGLLYLYNISGSYSDRIGELITQIESQLETDVTSWAAIDACTQYRCTPQSLRVDTEIGVFDCSVNGIRPICVKIDD